MLTCGNLLPLYVTSGDDTMPDGPHINRLRAWREDEGDYPEGAFVVAFLGFRGYEVFALHAVRHATKAGKGLSFRSIGFRHLGYGGSPFWELDVPEEGDCPYWTREVRRLHALPVSAFLELHLEQPLQDSVDPWSLATEVIVRSEYTPHLVQAFDARVRIPACFVELLRETPNQIVQFEDLSPQIQYLLRRMRQVYERKPELINSWALDPIIEWIDYPEPWEQRMAVNYIFLWLSSFCAGVEERLIDRFFSSSQLRISSDSRRVVSEE